MSVEETRRVARWPEAWAVPDDDLLASASSVESRHGRVVRVRTLGGWDVELLPDRCLDIGFAVHDGLPISWISPVRDQRSIDRPRQDDWLSRFNGGLLTTCGFRGFGPARADRGLHGDASHLPAGDVSIRRTITERSAEVTVTAEVRDARIFGATLRLLRSVTLRSDGSGAAELEVVDELVNDGPVETPIGMLYHLNLGAPLLIPGAIIDIPAEVVEHRDAAELIDPSRYPEPCADPREHVVEHSRLAAPGGRARARVMTPLATFTLEWSATTLPTLVEWVFPAVRRWALGLEPATSSLIDQDAPLNMLRPGATRRHELLIRVEQPL